MLAGRVGARRVIVAADMMAQHVGLRIGMPISKAQALVKELVVENAIPVADAEALHRLGLWIVQRFAPIAAVDPPDGIVIDSTGADHLHGGEQALAELLVSKLETVGLHATVAIADTWGAAHALARFSSRRIFISHPSCAEDDIQALPIAALRLPHTIVDGLHKLGFEHVGELFSQPRAPLALRFGPEVARRLDAACGRLAEPIEALRATDAIEVSRAFAEPIGAAETITRYIGKLVVKLCDIMEKSGVGARKLDLICHRVDGNAQAVRVGTALPLRDTKRMTKLLCDKIETIDPGFGIEQMSLTASAVDPDMPRQMASCLIEESEPDISHLVDLLSNRVGEQNLYRIAPVASDVPERSVRRVAPLAPEEEASWPEGWPRPARLLPRPEPIETMALLPDHPPVSFTWRGVRRRVKRADGPERVFGEWWKRDPELSAVRDYFRVEDETGERYWVFRSGDGEDPLTGSHCWFLHGVFG